MKAFLLCLTLLGLLSSAISQNSLASRTISTNDSEEERWNLDKYVWSHTHYQTGKNDKPALSFDLIDNWTVFENSDLSITPDGKYFAYTTRYTRNKQFEPDSLVIQSTAGLWRQSFFGTRGGFFLSDGAEYIFKKKETLYFVKTGTDQVQKVDGVLDYKNPDGEKTNWVAYRLLDKKLVLKNLLTDKDYFLEGISTYRFAGKGTWLTCTPVNDPKELILFDLANGEQKTFSSVLDYKLGDEGKALLLKKATENGGTELQYTTLPSGSIKTVWSSSDTASILQGYNLDRSGSQAVFTLQQKKGRQSTTALWYWRADMNKPVLKINSETKGIDGDLLSGETPVFSENGHYIKFAIEMKLEVLRPQPDGVLLNVWSYFDTVLQSRQLVEADGKKKVAYKAFIAIDGRQMIRETKYEKLKMESGDFLIMTKKGNLVNGDRFWEKGYYVDSNWLVSLKDGSRKSLPVTTKHNFWFSPNNKYLVYFDEKQECYFSYDLKIGKVENISGGIPNGQLVDKIIGSRKMPMEKDLNDPFGLASWREKAKKVWVYDRYDIWSLDLTGKKQAVNITNGYGNNNHIILRLSSCEINTIVKPSFIGKDILLKAQNEDTKYNGYYRLGLEKPADPEILYMAPCLLFTQMTYPFEGKQPLKATNADAWIIQKQSATEAPNYFLTTDFKNFKALTDFQLHRKYNWLSAELHQFKQLDGTTAKGILYKPENFDPLKKYPVIIIMYTALSNRLSVFPLPEYIQNPVVIMENPGWLVSHGYLVFLPDIDFTKGKWGACTANSIGGAAQYLAQLPFVDKNDIAASGHSNSGRFGFYLLTHSNVFKAMCIGSGETDVISESLSLDGDGKSALEWAETGSVGKGLGNLWQNKGEWLDHTAVLQADKITSPLLLYHNKLDGNDIRLALELYIAMRRLEKKVWWLEYDEEGHSQLTLKGRRDFTIRYTQYFDHFLKNAPAPRWMTQGIPAKYKTVESRLELDPAGNCGKEGKSCPICEAWNKQFKRNPSMFRKPVSEWKLDRDIQEELDKKETERYNENMKGETERIRENNDKLKGVWKGGKY